jgi:hypothetical protein
MGSRGQSSASRASKQDIRNNLDAQGHVSLNVADYKGMTGSAVRDFFAEQDYEVNALFNDKDEVICIQSLFMPNVAGGTAEEWRKAMEKDEGSNFTDFHNHPSKIGGIQIFSPLDVNSYVIDAAKSVLNTNEPRPTKYMVQTQNGSKFELAYTGNKTTDLLKTMSFAKKYETAFKNARKKATFDNTVTDRMAKWLRNNAPKCGFDVTNVLINPTGGFLL